MVPWKKVCSPKRFGGLGVKNLVAFASALRLHWLWLRWQPEDRPWKGTVLPCTEVDRALFSACTVISIGNGMLTSFWFDRWIDGAAPLDVAPDLFPLARRKKVSVHEALVDDLSMKGLERLNSAGQL